STFTEEELRNYSSISYNVMFTPQGDSIDLSGGLVAYYPFNGDALDHSGNDFHAEVFNATLDFDRKGFPNSAYAFDGQNDYLRVPHHPVLNFSNNFSISVWVKAQSY